MVIASLGHLVLDVIVRLKQPIAAGDDAGALISVGAGGQAANFAAWAAALGASARFIGAVGDDAIGQLVRQELAERGVDIVGPIRGRSAAVLSLVGSDGERTLASDRADAAAFAESEVDERWLAGCDWLHVSGYTLVEDPLARTAVEVARLARSAGARTSVDLSSAALIKGFGVARFRERLAAVAPDVVFANELEHEVIGDRAPWTNVVKRGARGATVIADGVATDFEAGPTVVADTTGAGDAFAAGYAVGGPALALAAASRCVAVVGAMP